jgi:arylsulfatase A-like enzyme
VLALAKPRVRRLVRTSGYLHALQRESRDCIRMLAQVAIPADRAVLHHALTQMARCRARRRPYFLFLNLYDVHAPYAPTPTSPLRSFRTPGGWVENLRLPVVLPRVASHAYLRPGFRLSAASRAMLRGRYHRAIELMDAKVGEFHAAARDAGLLDDTLLVVTSDHGEAFGEHGLYFHDASVYDTHLHVPLWIRHPRLAPAVVDDVVSTRGLFALLHAAGREAGLAGTLLDPRARAAAPVALAEHFHYPHTAGLLPQYTQDLAAAVVGPRKAILTRDGVRYYDLATDPEETAPAEGSVAEFVAACRRAGLPPAAIDAATAHLGRWERVRAAA